MASQVVETWVNDKLHDILGISDKYITLFLIELAIKSTSTEDFLYKLRETGTIDVGTDVVKFAKELWNKVNKIVFTLNWFNNFLLRTKNDF